MSSQVAAVEPKPPISVFRQLSSFAGLTIFLFLVNGLVALLSQFGLVPFAAWPHWNLPFELTWEAPIDAELAATNLAIACGIVLPAFYCTFCVRPGLLRRGIPAVILSAAVQGLFFIGYSALGWQAYVPAT
jgi:hypothetical protein